MFFEQGLKIFLNAHAPPPEIQCRDEITQPRYPRVTGGNQAHPSLVLEFAEGDVMVVGKPANPDNSCISWHALNFVDQTNRTGKPIGRFRPEFCESVCKKAVPRPILTVTSTRMNLNNLTNFMPESAGSSKNILAGDVSIKGTIRFESELIFDGKIDGEIISDGGNLTLGKNANVQGEVKTKSVVVHGTVTGNIVVSERCELKASSQLTGDLTAQRITIEEGATFVGKSEVTPGRAPAPRQTTPSAPAAEPARKTQPAAAS